MIKIKNIYYMLAYAFKVLNRGNYANLETEEFEHVADLFAAILIKGIGNQVKRGLGRDYIGHTDTLKSPRGKIAVAQSVKQNTLLHKQLICNYDEYTENTYINQILKATVTLLVKNLDVSGKNKNHLKKLLLYFSNVDRINYRNIKWSTIKYHRHNATYKLLINICYLVIEGLLLTEQDGNRKLAHFINDQQMHSLFEKFVLEYYRKHYPEFKASPSQINWNIDDGSVEFLPIMKTDITLTYGETTLIIDTKYYSNTMQTNNYYNSRSFHSGNMYQIFSYVKNRDSMNSGSVSGVLLYAKTDEDIVPDSEFSMGGNWIGVKTLDMNHDFSSIKKQLNILAERFLLSKR